MKITSAPKAGKKVGFASYIRYNPRVFEAAAGLAAIEIRTSIGKFQQDACSGRQASTGVYPGYSQLIGPSGKGRDSGDIPVLE